MLLLAALLRFGEELEIIAGHDSHGLAQIGEQARRAGGQVQGSVEAAVGCDHVVGALDGAGQVGELGQLSRRHAARRHLGRFADQGGEDGEVVDGVLGGDAHHRHATARGDLDQTLVGELEQGLPDRRPADAELGRQPVEVQAVARLQPAGEDPVGVVRWPPGP